MSATRVPATSPAVLAGSRARPDRSGRASVADALRTLRTAMRLGWRTESNWTDPVLFLIYSVAKPVASVLILLVMLEVVSGGSAQPQFRSFVVVGSSLWAFVVGGMAGLAWSVLDDRERYRMLKYLYVSPNSLLIVLLGRGAARIAIAGMGAVITLAMGVLFLGVPFDATAVNWPMAILTMAIGLVAIVALGIALAAVCLQTRQESWSYPEAVAGATFLVVGAVFPLLVLPAIAQVCGLLLPFTWWLEGVRRALFPGTVTAIGGPGSVWTQVTGTAAPSSAECLIGLLMTTLVVTLASLGAYRWSERRAKERGLIDQTTGS